jgi:hypothetical protein
MGVNIRAHSTRIGTLMIVKELATGDCEEVVMGNQILFLGLALTVQIMFIPARKLEGGNTEVMYYIL